MSTRRLVSLIAVTVAALVAVPAVADAKTVEFRGVVSGSPYGASGGYMAVPVLFSKQTLRYQHLKTPVGLVMVKRKLQVKLPNGAPRIAPANMRVGDRFKGKVTMKSIYKRTFYPRVVFKQLTVYVRSKELSTAELNEMILKLRKDLDKLSAFVGNLANYTVANFADLRAQLADLRAQLDGLRSALAGLTGQLQALTAQLDAITQMLQDKLDALTDDLAGVTAQVQALLASVGDLQDDLSALTGRVQALEDALDLLNGALGPLTGLSGNLLSRITTLESTLTDLQTLLNGLDPTSLGNALNTLTGLQTDVAGLLLGATGLDGRLDDVESALGPIGTQLSGLVDTVTGAGGITEQLTGLTGDVAGLNLSSADALSQIGDLQDALDLTNTNLADVSDEVFNTLTPNVGGLLGDVGTLQDQMGSVCTQLNQNIGATNSLVGLVDTLTLLPVPSLIAGATC